MAQACDCALKLCLSLCSVRVLFNRCSRQIIRSRIFFNCPSRPPRRCAASAAFCTTVAAARSSSNPHKTRSRKRRAEVASPPAKSAAKQATTNAPVLPYPATRSSTKSTTGVTFSAGTSFAELFAAVSKAPRSSTHAVLQQFARPPSRELSVFFSDHGNSISIQALHEQTARQGNAHVRPRCQT